MKKVLICVGAGVFSIAAVGTLAAADGRFARFDVNGDGLVTEAEFTAHQQALFNEADANGDRAVDPAEMTAYREAKRAERRKQNNPDANADGAIDRDEFLAAAEARFERLDRDGDGVLEEDERPRKRGWRRRSGDE